MANDIMSTRDLSPDGSGRFFMMAKLLEILNRSAKNVKLLDVGGGSHYMAEVLHSSSFGLDLTTIDILPKPTGFKGKYIQGDATKMEFADQAYDTVISTDTLEHIPSDKKSDFIKECIRVAKDYVIIAAPFDTEGVDQAERATNDLNKKLFKEGQVWLEEHFENKKPSITRTLSIAEKMGYETYVVGTNNLYIWLISTHVNLIEAKLGLDKKSHIKANEHLNDVILASGDMTPPYYRHFVVIAKKKLTQSQKSLIQEMILPKVNHTPTIQYTHQLLSLVSDSIQDRVRESKRARVLEQRVNKEAELQQTIDMLRRKILEKDEALYKSRHYLRIISAIQRMVRRSDSDN